MVQQNKGVSQVKVLIVSVGILLMLCAALYSRLNLQNIRQKAQLSETASQNPAASFSNTEKMDDGPKEIPTQRPSNQLTVVEQNADLAADNQQNDNPSEEKPTDISTQNTGYYYAYLSENEKIVYAEIYDALVNRKDELLSTLDTEIADKIYNFVMDDHPEIFYIDGYKLAKNTINQKTVSLTISAKYTMEPQEIMSYEKQIEQVVDTFLQNMPMGLDTYGKIKYAFEYIVKQTEYKVGAPNNQNICSVFLTHSSVCAGYARAFQYLMQRLDIPVAYVVGKSERQGHAWNLVYVDGNPYYVDVTWGDPSYSENDEATDRTWKRPEVNYDYLLITTNDLQKTHTIERTEYFPIAQATDANYYRRENLFFTSFDKEQLHKAIDQAYFEAKSTLTIRVENDNLLYEMTQALIDNQEIVDYLRVKDRFLYNINENMRTFTIWLE